MWDCDKGSIPWNPYIVAWKYKGCTLKKVSTCVLNFGTLCTGNKSLWINIYLILVTIKIVNATKISDLKMI